MNTKFSIILMFSFLIIFSSCKENLVTNSSSFIPGIENTSKKSNISIAVNSYSFSKNPLSSIDISGSFLDQKGNLIDIDSLIIGGVSINKEQNKFAANFNKVTHKDDFSNYVNLFTKDEVIVNIKDDEFGKITAGIPAIEPIKIALPDGNKSILKKSEGLTIKWNSRHNNSLLRTEEKVGISVTYHSGTSRRVNPDLPLNNISIQKTALDSEGEITFTPDELSVLPTGGIVIVYIGRGEQVIVEYGVVDNVLTYLTYSSTGDLTVLD